ncbi:hypothetical protein OYT00_14105 [Microbacterium paraoxydans]|uniref:hypothetical protein n=1 Tax=Microbacterium paraoxydans TaxID=199592 RepID=UPI002286A582|nr:hypothetical protein [Microbacterium paraoxydans]MCZ0711141.1 hypothetical protein [Microbacterium paraoxydans]
MPLEWREASHADRGALSVFVCAYPAKASRDPVTHQPSHPQPWQLKVQSGLRAQRPPLKEQRLIVGYDDDGLAAVGMYEPLPEDRAFYIRAVARAQRLAHLRVADELLANLIERITLEREFVEFGYQDAFCEIHWRNGASKKLFARAGFACAGHNDASDLETWVIDLSAGAIEVEDVDPLLTREAQR